LQLGRFAALVDPDPLPRPVDVEPDAPPVPLAPALPDEPSVLPPALDPPVLEPVEPEPAEPTVPPLLPELEPEPEAEPKLELEPEPELFIALFSWICPFASRQCVVGDTLLVSVAPGEPLIEPELDWADAESTPHATSAEARSVVFRNFISLSFIGLPPGSQSRDRPSVPGTAYQIAKRSFGNWNCDTGFGVRHLTRLLLQ
jgi:hypothetical protein